MKTASNSAYMNVFTLADAHLISYRDDLEKHDKASIEANPCVPFLHWTRASGTDLVFLWPAHSKAFPAKGVEVPFLFGTADREHLLNSTVATADYWTKGREEVKLCLYFDGAKVRRVTEEDALQIALRYANCVKAAWKSQEQAPTIGDYSPITLKLHHQPEKRNFQRNA